MEHSIDHRPSFAQLAVDLDADEQVVAEAGALVEYAGDVAISTGARGGVISSLKRKALGGESFFVNTYTANGPASVSLAPALPGDVVHQRVDGRLLVQSGSFLAADPEIDVDTKFGGGRTFFGGEGLFLLDLQGAGPVFLASYGAISSREIAPGETHVVDTGHIVAFEPTLDWSVDRIGGLKSTLFSGEGLVCEFTGPGTVWTQSRSTDALIAWLAPKLPSRESGGVETGGGFHMRF